MTIETSFIVIHILDPNLRLSQRYNGGRAPFQFMQRMKPRRERGEYHDERRHEYKFEYTYKYIYVFRAKFIQGIFKNLM